MNEEQFLLNVSLVKDKMILILIVGHLCMQPRAQKEAKLLRHAGANVAIRCTWFSDGMAAEDRDIANRIGVEVEPVIDLRRRTISTIILRMRQRFARECYARFGWVTARAFGLGSPEFLREARVHNADLTILHSESGLWVAEKLLADGRRVGFDMLDWFSQDLPPVDRKERPVGAMQVLERHLLRRAHFCLTTTHVLAEALEKDAGTTRLPVVVPNCFPASERQMVQHVQRCSKLGEAVTFHWFSQTIGPWRGLETLAQALPLLRGEWVLTLRGNLGGNQKWFADTFPANLRDRIQLLAPVSNAELLAYTIPHDIGLALEVQYCPSRDLTATNKIFEYLRAGLAVIASQTRGQEEVMKACPNAGMLVEPDDPVALAYAMQKMLDDAEYLSNCRRFSAEAGGTVWSWETHSPKLLNAVADALAIPLP